MPFLQYLDCQPQPSRLERTSIDTYDILDPLMAEGPLRRRMGLIGQDKLLKSLTSDCVFMAFCQVIKK